MFIASTPSACSSLPAAVFVANSNRSGCYFNPSALSGIEAPANLLDIHPRHRVSNPLVSMMIVLLIIHGLLAVGLLGAITHQAIGAWLPGRPGADTFIGRMRSVSTPAYVTAVIVLFIA